jgi:hypothetical protein
MGGIVNNLSVDMLVRPKYRQTGPLRGAKYATTNAGVATTG